MISLEQRVRKLERLVKESLSEKDFAQMEIEDIITDMVHQYSRRILSKIRADVTGSKQGPFVDIVSEIITNQNDAYEYFMSMGNSTDDLYDCEKLDDMILDTVQSLSM